MMALNHLLLMFLQINIVFCEKQQNIFESSFEDFKRYDYKYGVDDNYFGTKFGHEEIRDGYKTEGEYFVHLPDGRIQTVKYIADDNGYQPTVTYLKANGKPIKRYKLENPSFKSHINNIITRPTIRSYKLSKTIDPGFGVDPPRHGTRRRKPYEEIGDPPNYFEKFDRPTFKPMIDNKSALFISSPMPKVNPFINSYKPVIRKYTLTKQSAKKSTTTSKKPFYKPTFVNSYAKPVTLPNRPKASDFLKDSNFKFPSKNLEPKLKKVDLDPFDNSFFNNNRFKSPTIKPLDFSNQKTVTPFRKFGEFKGNQPIRSSIPFGTSKAPLHKFNTSKIPKYSPSKLTTKKANIYTETPHQSISYKKEISTGNGYESKHFSTPIYNRDKIPKTNPPKLEYDLEHNYIPSTTARPAYISIEHIDDDITYPPINSPFFPQPQTPKPSYFSSRTQNTDPLYKPQHGVPSKPPLYGSSTPEPFIRNSYEQVTPIPNHSYRQNFIGEISSIHDSPALTFTPNRQSLETIPLFGNLHADLEASVVPRYVPVPIPIDESHTEYTTEKSKTHNHDDSKNRYILLDINNDNQDDYNDEDYV